MPAPAPHDVVPRIRGLSLQAARVFTWLAFGTLTFSAERFQVLAGAAVADIALVLAVACGVVGGAFRWPLAKSHTTLLVGVGVVVISGLVATLVSNRPAALGDLAAFVLVVSTTGGFAATATPQLRRSSFLEPRFALIGGGILGGLWGLATGPTVFAGRVSGLTAHPNSYGFACFLTAAVSATILLETERSRWYAPTVGLVVGAAGCVESGSRAALGALLIFGALTMAVLMRRAAASSSIGLLVVLAIGVVTARYWTRSIGVDRLLGSSPSVNQADVERSASLRASLALIDERPFLGSGFADALSAHSLPFQLWQIAGVMGLATFALWAYLLVLVPTGHILLRSLRDLEARILLGPPVLAWALVSNALWELELWMAITLGTADAAVRRHRSAPDSRPLSSTGRS